MNPLDTSLLGIFFLIVLVIAILLIIIRTPKSPVETPFPYEARKLLTPAEYSFFKVLERVIGNDFYIFTQVALSSLVKVKYNTIH